MDVIWDAIQSGLQWLVAGLGAVVIATCWNRIKRAFKVAGNWFWRELQWVIVAKLIVKYLRVVFDALKNAESPRHRAYLLLQAHSLLLQQVTELIGHPGMSKQVAVTIGEVEHVIHPIIQGYVDLVLAAEAKATNLPAPA